jgi:hypothetical protein
MREVIDPYSHLAIVWTMLTPGEIPELSDIKEFIAKNEKH